MDIIVLDLEWNQNSLGKKERSSDKPVFEIIEIGAVKLNENYEMTGKFSQLVKPQIYHTMHKITADLIHLQMKELKKGKDFPTVMKEFLEWCGKDYIFATWGPLDLLELQRNMEYYNMESLAEAFYNYAQISQDVESYKSAYEIWNFLCDECPDIEEYKENKNKVLNVLENFI